MPKSKITTKYRKQRALLESVLKLNDYLHQRFDMPELMLSTSAPIAGRTGAPNINGDKLLTPKQVSTQLGISVKTLANWRVSGTTSLKHVKIGSRILYSRAAIDAFVSASTKTSTSHVQNTWGTL